MKKSERKALMEAKTRTDDILKKIDACLEDVQQQLKETKDVCKKLELEEREEKLIDTRTKLIEQRNELDKKFPCEKRKMDDFLAASAVLLTAAGLYLDASGFPMRNFVGKDLLKSVTGLMKIKL